MKLKNLFKKEKKAPVAKKPEKKEKKAPVAKKPVSSASAWRVLDFPHITEKASWLAEKNQYIFRVKEGVNKSEIKKALSNLYNIDVLKVRIINIPRKKRRLRRTEGWKKGYKKAVVTIKKGQEIEILPK